MIITMEAQEAEDRKKSVTTNMHRMERISLTPDAKKRQSRVET